MGWTVGARIARLMLTASVLCAGLSVAMPPPTLAQVGTPDEVSEARALFMAGRSAYNDGRYEAALDYFKQSYALSGKPLLLFNIGQCHDRLRNDAQAIETFEAYLAAMPSAENRKEVEARLIILRRSVQAPAAGIEPPAAGIEPPAAGIEPPAAGTDPSAAVANSQEAPLPEGPTTSLHAPKPTATVTGSREAGGPGDAGSGEEPLPLGPLIVMGAGGAVAITGVVLMVLGQGAIDDLNDRLDRGDRTLTLSEIESDEASANGLFVGGQVTLGLGLATVAGGALWWVLGRRARAHTTSDAQASSAWHVTPTPTGVVARGRF